MEKIIKEVFIVIFVVLSKIIFAQFPAPSNLAYSYDYIMIGDEDYCDGLVVHGPAYCFSFTWSAPDTSLTSATLDHYNLYYFSAPGNDTSLVDSSAQTYLEINAGFIGYLFVTAIYTGPGGESAPSNIVFVDDLPISVPDVQQKCHHDLHYDQLSETLTFHADEEGIDQLVIRDDQGRAVISVLHPQQTITMNNLPAGLYIVELVYPDQVVIRKKIIK
jgi:hypothetical protein